MRLRPVLVISGHPDIRQAFKGLLQSQKHPVCFATSSEEALDFITQAPPLLAFMEIFMNQEPNLYLLARIKSCYPDLPVILLTNTKTIDIAESGLKKGALDVLTTPFNLAHLRLSVAVFLEIAKKNLGAKNEETSVFLPLPSLPTFPLERRMTSFLSSSSPLLIQGERGVGKETLALWLHRHGSLDCPAPFKRVDAYALQAQTFDEILFGQEEPGFGLNKIGLLNDAFGGTLLIRNIHELTNEAQKKLANLLRKRTFKRLHGSEIPLNTRIITTSIPSLEEFVQKGQFSQTLLDYLKINIINLLPLRERKQDISVLADHFLSILCQRYHQPKPKISPQSLSNMEKYHWPGNINELQNTLERSLMMSRPRNMAPLVCDIPQDRDMDPANHTDFRYLNHPLKRARMLFEQHYLKNQLERFDANIQRTAVFVGMERSALHRKIRALGLDNYHRRDKKIAS